MKFAVFTSNQPRHLALVEALAAVGDEVFAVIECNTVFPGEVADFFQKSDTMQRYFSKVIEAERRIFGAPRFLAGNVHPMAVKMGDLSRIDTASLGPAFDADQIVVFGASYIRGPLCEQLVARRAINVHMGTSPYYRGSSCNFWALYDERPDLVGATIHLLSKGLDSGDILFQAFPAADAIDPFDLGMRAVQSAQSALVDHLAHGTLFDDAPVPQDASLELRYSRNADFTDDVALDFLQRAPNPEAIRVALEERPAAFGIRPHVG